MKKRALATVLWFYSMWYAGAMIAQVFGLSPALGPILGTAAAAIVAVDPRRIIWTSREARAKARETGAVATGTAVQTPI